MFSQENGQLGINVLTEEEYKQIKINEVPLEQILFFKGGLAEISELLEMPFSKENPDPEALSYKNDEMLLVYGNALHERTLYYLEILSNQAVLEIKGNVWKLGESISGLDFEGTLNSKPLKNGSFCALFKQEKESAYICIEFDPQSGVIRKINYLSPT
ncbi:hypothetical protein GCM10010465_06090 [Actinomadura fibrosa]